MNVSLRQAQSIMNELIRAVDNTSKEHRTTGWMLEHFCHECGLTNKEQRALRTYTDDVLMKA
jgi:hypothetical protein